MRSEEIFAAANKIGNRFLLCRPISVAARRLQKGPKPFAESINESVKLVASMPPREEKGSATGELRISPDHPFVLSEQIFDSYTSGASLVHSGSNRFIRQNYHQEIASPTNL